MVGQQKVLLTTHGVPLRRATGRIERNMDTTRSSTMMITPPGESKLLQTRPRRAALPPPSPTPTRATKTPTDRDISPRPAVRPDCPLASRAFNFILICDPSCTRTSGAPPNNVQAVVIHGERGRGWRRGKAGRWTAGDSGPAPRTAGARARYTLLALPTSWPRRRRGCDDPGGY